MFLSFHPNGPETSSLTLTSTSQLLSSIKYLEFNTHIFNSCDFMPISPIFNSISGYLLTQYKLRSKNIYQRGSLSFLGPPAACVSVTSTKTDTGAGWWLVWSWSVRSVRGRESIHNSCQAEPRPVPVSAPSIPHTGCQEQSATHSL